MSIKFISVKCPECGASLSIEENRNQAFCSYCGTKILIHNENEHVLRYVDEAGVKKAENERKIIELNEIIRQEEKIEEKEKRNIGVVIILVGAVLFGVGLVKHSPYVSSDVITIWGYIEIVGLFMLIIGWSMIKKKKTGSTDIRKIEEKESFSNKYEEKRKKEEARKIKEVEDAIKEGKIKVPKDSIPFVEIIHYQTMVDILKNAGFTNIKCIPLRDLNSPLMKSKDEGMRDIYFDGEKYVPGFFKADYLAPDTPIVIAYHSYKKDHRK